MANRYAPGTGGAGQRPSFSSRLSIVCSDTSNCVASQRARYPFPASLQIVASVSPARRAVLTALSNSCRNSAGGTSTRPAKLFAWNSKDAVDGHDLQLEIEFNDLLDGHRQGPLGMELVQERLRPAPEVIVGEDRRAERHATSCG